MGTHIEIGSASSFLEAEEPATAPGVTRLQSSCQQSVNQAQDGPWVIVNGQIVLVPCE